MSDKNEVKKILEKEVLSFWDFKVMLEYIMFAIQEGKTEDGTGIQLICTPVSKEVNEYIEMIINQTASISANLITFQEKITAQLQEAYNAYEKKWNELYAKKRKLDEQISTCDFPNIKLPYNWKEYLEIADRLAEMSPEKAEAFAKFCKLIN
jgi:hypothetical protein